MSVWGASDQEEAEEAVMVADVEFIEQLDLFNGLAGDELTKVLDLCTEVSFNAGDIILHVHDSVDSLFLIRSGTAQVSVTSEREQGAGAPEEQVLVTLGQGQTFGEMGLVDCGTRSANVRAGSDIDLYAIKCEQFIDLCERSPQLGYRVMRNIAADLSFKLRHNIRA